MRVLTPQSRHHNAAMDPTVITFMVVIRHAWVLGRYGVN